MYGKDYYRIMGISPDSTEEEIKSAYRKLAMQYHPDRNGNDPRSVERLKEINDAYHILGNKERKKAYDVMYSHRIKDDPFMEKVFMHTDAETIFRAFSRDYKVSRRPFCKGRGFGRRGCGRGKMRWA